MLVCAAVYALWFAFWSSWRLLSYQLGMDWVIISDSVMWAARGHLLGSGVREAGQYTNWQEHFSPLLLAYVPLAKIDGTLALLAMVVSQGLANAAAGWLLFLIARSWLRHEPAALCAALFWFANGRVQVANLHDFHAITLAPLFLFLAFAGAAGGRRPWMWAGFIGTLLLREDAFLALLGLPLFLFLLERRRREALLMLAIVAAYEAIVFGLVFPALGPGYRFFSYFDWLAPSPGALLARIATEPHAVLSAFLSQRDNVPLLRFLGLYGFLPLLSPGGWLVGSGAMVVSLLSRAGNLTSYGYHYVVPPAAMLSLGTLLSLRFWGDRLASRIAPGRLGTVALLALTVFNLQQDTDRGAMPWSSYLRRPDVSVNRELLGRVRAVDALVARIPPAEQVEFGLNLFTRWHERPGSSLYRGRARIDSETRWILLDRRSRLAMPPLDELIELVRSGSWRVEANDRDVFLLSRGPETRPQPPPVTYFWYNPMRVPTEVGVRTHLGRLVGEEGRPGWLLLGPALSPPGGRYRLSIDLGTDAPADAPAAEIVVPALAGEATATRLVSAAELARGRPVEMEFTVERPTRPFELRIRHLGGGRLTFAGARLDWLGEAPDGTAN